MLLSPQPAAVLWTGGKDSCLALHEAAAQGWRIERLVTFVPEEAAFRAHPLAIMALQARCLGLPHECLTVREPYDEGYRRAIAELAAQGIRALVTGDIDLVDGHPNWVRACAAGSGAQVLTPLWEWDREAVLERLWADGYETIFSCVKAPWFDAAWLGRRLTRETRRAMDAITATPRLDPCGENGEYHTLALDAPRFSQKIHIECATTQDDGKIMTLAIQRAGLREK